MVISDRLIVSDAAFPPMASTESPQSFSFHAAFRNSNSCEAGRMWNFDSPYCATCSLSNVCHRREPVQRAQKASARWARRLAKPCQRLFAAPRMPHLEISEDVGSDFRSGEDHF